MIYVIKDIYTDEVVASSATYEDAEQFVLNIAYTQNYGFYRFWYREPDACKVFDCGVRVLVIIPINW